MRITIDSNAAEVEARMRQYPGALREALSLGVRDVADEIFAESQQPPPLGVPVDRGTLKKSGNVELTGTLSAAVGYNTPYAAAVHYGFEEQDVMVRSHTRLLRTGKMTRVKSHRRHIGPRKGTFYLSRAVERVAPFIPELISRRIRDAWAKIRGGAA